VSLQTLSHYHSQLHLLDDDLALSQLDHLLTDLLAAEELRCTATSGDYADEEVCGAALGQLGGYARVLEKVLPMQVEAKDDKVVEMWTEAVRVQVSR